MQISCISTGEKVNKLSMDSLYRKYWDEILHSKDTKEQQFIKDFMDIDSFKVDCFIKEVIKKAESEYDKNN